MQQYWLSKQKHVWYKCLFPSPLLDALLASPPPLMTMILEIIHSPSQLSNIYQHLLDSCQTSCICVWSYALPFSSFIFWCNSIWECQFTYCLSLQFSWMWWEDMKNSIICISFKFKTCEVQSFYLKFPFPSSPNTFIAIRIYAQQPGPQATWTVYCSQPCFEVQFQ